MSLPGLKASPAVILWKCFKQLCCLLVDVLSWLKICSFETDYQFLEKEKIHMARCGEYRACSSTGICFPTKSRRTEIVLHTVHCLALLKFSHCFWRIFSPSIVILMPKQWSVLTRVSTFSTILSVVIFNGRTDSRPAHSSSPHSLFLLKTSCAI